MKCVWLLENPSHSMCLGLCDKKLKLVTFTDKAAMRFDSKESAELYLLQNYILLEGFSVHEHGFMEK